MKRAFHLLTTSFFTLVGFGIAHAGAAVGAPAPLIGSIGGPIGVLAAAICYGGYRFYKAKNAPR